MLVRVPRFFVIESIKLNSSGSKYWLSSIKLVSLVISCV